MSEFTAVVTDIREESRMAGRQRWQIALDRTDFRPAGGGDVGIAGIVGIIEAVTPRGSRLTVPVLGVVVDAAGEVWHVVEKPLAAGTAVTVRAGSQSCHGV